MMYYYRRRLLCSKCCRCNTWGVNIHFYKKEKPFSIFFIPDASVAYTCISLELLSYEVVCLIKITEKS